MTNILQSSVTEDVFSVKYDHIVYSYSIEFVTSAKQCRVPTALLVYEIFLYDLNRQQLTAPMAFIKLNA